MQNPAAKLRQLLVNPTDHSSKRIDDLLMLVDRYPQSGLLRALLATSGDEQHIKAAAVWHGGQSLHKVITSPGSLLAVPDRQIIKLDRKPASLSKPEPVVAVPEIVAGSAVETAANQPAIPSAETPDNYYEVVEPEAILVTPPPAEPVSTNIIEPVDDKPKPAESLLPKLPTEKLEETQKLIIENIASSNYFVFDQAFAERNPSVIPSAEVTNEQPQKDSPSASEQQPLTEDGQVTPYNDVRMPYSFLWWLDKTRREHASIYQPYTAPQQPASTPEPSAEVTAAVKEVLHQREREEAIIDRFIQEEPQIKPPSSDKLDNENKARRSAEDQDELITETLARIYIDQTLYSKAIAAYKILMLKNPEKSRYFASQIEMLSKKI